MSKKFVYKEGVTKKYEVLKEAMKYLAKDTQEMRRIKKYEYICHAIGEVINPENPFADNSFTKNEILSRIIPSYSLETWLMNKIGSDEIEYDREFNQQKKLQSYRKDWMQSLYEEFKSKNE